jgi:phage gpG-like protein
MHKALLPAMTECMLAAEATAKKDYLSGPRPGKLQRLTGRLRGNIAHREKLSGDRVTGILGTNVIYGRIHELGGEIRPKTAQYLKFQINGRWKSVRKVTMPARPFLRPAMEDNLDKFKGIFRRRLVEAFGK